MSPLRLRVLSDLHIERAPFEAGPDEPPDAAYDVVVLAGDIHNGPEALRWARRRFPRHRIVQIAGNHEFYDHDYDACLAALREQARHEGIDFLENDAIVIDGVRFLGCTLWTDFRAFETPGRPLSMDREAAMAASLGRVADYRAIGLVRDGARRVFAPLDGIALHEASLRFLDAARSPVPAPAETSSPSPAASSSLASTASSARASRLVVVGHHLPSWRSVTPAFADARTNAAYCSDLDDRLAGASLWIHGHTHASVDWRADGCRVLCNARGYPRRDPPGTFENPAFRSDLIVEV